MKRLGLLALALVLCAGCGRLDAVPTPAPTPAETPAPETEDAALYRQLALYIRRGLRDYGLPGKYTLSFGPLEDLTETRYGNVAVEGGDGILSMGTYDVSWDPVADWYTFTSVYEPFLVGKECFLDRDWEAVYTLELDTETPPAELEKFDSPPAPVETTFRHWNSFEHGKASRETYHYVDRRLGIDLMGDYPDFYDEAEADAAFYQVLDDFFFQNGDARKSPFTTLELTYCMTREDEDFASARFYHNACTRGAAHPSDWETGVTVERATGKVLTLDDVLDWDGNAATLLEGYDWKPSWTWEGGSERDEIDGLIQTLKNSDGWIYGFYLTEDRLGLIVGFSRYYTPIECPLSELPIKLDKLT